MVFFIIIVELFPMLNFKGCQQLDYWVRLQKLDLLPVPLDGDPPNPFVDGFGSGVIF